MKKLKEKILILFGSFFLVLGIIGVIVPLLPTTPFLLLAAACFVRSSEKLYNRLINNRFLGIYIKNYLAGNGIPLNVKVSSITLLWVTIGFSTIFVVNNNIIRLLLLLVAVGVTAHIVLIKKK